MVNISEYLQRPIDVDERLCFVIMPFAPELQGVYEGGIKPLVQELGFTCRRADEHLASTSIMFEIFDNIIEGKGRHCRPHRRESQCLL